MWLSGVHGSQDVIARDGEARNIQTGRREVFLVDLGLQLVMMERASERDTTLRVAHGQGQHVPIWSKIVLYN
jgi:hypothetical protein